MTYDVISAFAVTPPSGTGIYFLFVGDDLIYIGQTGALHQRLAIHRSSGVFFDRVLWLEVVSGDLDAYEGALVRALQPPLVRRVSRDTTRDAEILARLGVSPAAFALTARHAPRRHVERTAFALRLKQLREHAGLDQKEFAARVGIAQSVACDWEQGRMRPRGERLDAIAAVLGCTAVDLLAAHDPNLSPASSPVTTTDGPIAWTSVDTRNQ